MYMGIRLTRLYIHKMKVSKMSSKVYIKIDDNTNITDINSDIFIKDLRDWIKIDEGTGDKYAHAQGHYFNKPLINENGVYNYKYMDGVVIEKTPEEIAAETPELVEPITIEDRLTAVENTVMEMLLM